MVLLSLITAYVEQTCFQGEIAVHGLAIRTLTFGQVTKSEDDRAQKELHSYRLALLRKSALSLVDYVAFLKEQHFREFWLPCTFRLFLCK